MEPQNKKTLPNQAEQNANPVSEQNPPQPTDESARMNQIINSSADQLLETQNLFTKKNPFYLRLWFWIVILIMLLLGWVGYSYFLAPNDSPSDIFHLLNIDISKPNSPLKSETASWKTYSDTNLLKISFKYPSDWKYNLIQDPALGSGGNISIFTTDDKSQKFPGSTVNISVVEKVKGVDVAPLDKAAEVIYGPITNYDNITVDGVKAIKFTTKIQSLQPHMVKSVVFYNNNKYYYISQSYKIDSKNPYPNVIDNIVSTFKFN